MIFYEGAGMQYLYDKREPDLLKEWYAFTKELYTRIINHEFVKGGYKIYSVTD